MNIPLISTLSLVFMSLSTYSLSAQADVNDGRLLASQCAQCHGTDGYSNTDIDRLAGKDDIVEEMLEMRAKADNDDIMVKQAHGYTETEINLIAAYFASLPSQNDDDQSGNDRDDDQSGNDQDDGQSDNDRDDDQSGNDRDDDQSDNDRDDDDQDDDRFSNNDNDSDNVIRNIRWWLRWD